LGEWKDYNREFAVDSGQLFSFLWGTQTETAEALDLKKDSP